MAKDLNVSLGLLAENFKRGLKQAGRDLRKFGRQTEAIGRNLTNSLSVPLAGAGLAAIKSAADFDRLRGQLESVVGDAGLAADQIQRLKKIAEEPGLGFEQAIKASARLQALKLSSEQAEATIQAFGKAVARSGGGAAEFDGAITALGQIISKGKISAEEINQLNERIFEIRPALEAAFGTSNSEELQKLGISSEEFVAKITGEFAKLPPVQKTLFTAFENLAIGAKSFFAEIGNGINEIFNVQDAVTRFTDFLTRLGDRFRELDPAIKKTILQVAAIAVAIGPVILGVGTLATGLTAFLNPIGLTIAAIGALAAGFVALYNNNEQFRKGVQRVGQYLKAGFSAAFEVVVEQFRNLIPLLDATKDFTIELGKALISLATVGAPNVDTLRLSVEKLSGEGLILLKIYSGVSDGIKGLLLGLVNSATAAVKSFQESFASLKEGDFKTALKSLGKAFISLNPTTLAQTEGKKLATGFLDSFKDGFQNDPITEFFAKVREKVAEQSKKTQDTVQNSTNSPGIDLTSFGTQFERQTDDKEVKPSRTFGDAIEVLPTVFDGVIPKAEQLKLQIEQLAQNSSLIDLFPEKQIEALDKGIKSTAALQDAQKKYNKELSIAQNLTSLFAPAFDELFDTIAQGGKSAFKAFGDAIKSILADLAKALVKAAIFAGITALITGGAGTFVNSFKGLLGQFSGLNITNLANGGIIPNRTYLTGEEGAEAIIPLDRDAQIPVRIEVDDIQIKGTDIFLSLKQSEGITDRFFG